LLLFGRTEPTKGDFMANRNSNIPAQPRNPDRRDPADDRMRGDVENVRGVGDDEDEFEDLENTDEEADEEEEEGTL
jgi:hypothetical protein